MTLVEGEYCPNVEQKCLRWLEPPGSAPGAWADTCLPARLAPGASALIPLVIEAPRSAGRHTLELELVHEDLLRGALIRRFAVVSLPIDVEAAELNPWERPLPASRGDRARRSLRTLVARAASRGRRSLPLHLWASSDLAKLTVRESVDTSDAAAAHVELS